jgi:hypothetical protein
MPITPEQRDAIAAELRSIVTSLNLSEDQKQKLQTFMTEASEKVEAYKQQNPHASREDLVKKVTENRTAIRQRLENFLTPAQLTLWDAEMSKVREFLGQKLAA